MPTLYDHRGEPIRTSDLRREHSAPRWGSIRSPSRSSQASSLTPSRLGSLLRRADEGDTEAYFTLAEEVEERDGHYRSVISTRKLGVSGADAIVEAASDGARDQRVADAVREAITSQPWFEGVCTDALDALGKGVSILEILWQTSASQWTPVGAEWRDPRWFLWDRDAFTQPLLPTEANPLGEPLAPAKYIVHTPKLKSGIPIRGGLARTAVAGIMLKSYTLRDWSAFIETFGMPLRLGRYDKGATDEERDTLLAAVMNIGSDAAAIVPDSMKIEFHDARGTAGAEKLFAASADWWDRTLSKLVLGQTMTADSGSSRAQAQVHNEVRLDLRKADGRALAATLNRDLVAPFVALNYGPRVRPPRIRFAIEAPEDLVAYMQAVTSFVELGGEVEASVVRDKLGLPDPKPGAVMLRPKASAPTPASAPAPETPPAPPEDDPNDPEDDEGDDEGDDAVD